MRQHAPAGQGQGSATQRAQGSTTPAVTSSSGPSDKAKARVTGARLLQAAGRQSKCSELWKQFARRECARVYAVTVCHCTHGSCA